MIRCSAQHQADVSSLQYARSGSVLSQLSARRNNENRASHRRAANNDCDVSIRQFFPSGARHICEEF